MAVKVGIIGAGRIGKVHTENLQTRISSGEVVAIADINQSAAEETARRFNVPKVTRRYQDILNDPAIQAVVIGSSTDTHAQIAEDAAQAGKHIFCEKPIDLSLERIDQVLETVKKCGVQFQVGFNRRFDPNFSRIRQAVEKGEIGTPHLLHIISRDPSPPPINYVKVSGGIFMDMMIHDFDMARFLIGSDITEVYATGGVRVNPEIGKAGDIDTAVVMLKFANGVIGTIDNSRQAVYGYDQRVEVFGSGGAAAASNNYPNNVTFSSAEKVYRDLPLNFFMGRYTESYVIEMRAFIEALVNGSPVPASGEDGRQAVRVAKAARQSYDENRPVCLD
jgi:myo-inositol 2-dehydrogenase/D-chiro-inositol 1-dehydrogenase